MGHQQLSLSKAESGKPKADTTGCFLRFSPLGFLLFAATKHDGRLSRIIHQGERFRKRRLLRLASPKRAHRAVCARSDSREAVRRKTQTWKKNPVCASVNRAACLVLRLQPAVIFRAIVTIGVPQADRSMHPAD